MSGCAAPNLWRRRASSPMPPHRGATAPQTPRRRRTAPLAPTVSACRVPEGSKRQIVARRPSSGSRPMPPNCSALVWKSLKSNVSPWRAPGRVAAFQPQPLADLVRRRLPRPAEVAVDLVGAVRRIGDRAGEQELEPELRRPALPLVEPGAGRDLQLQVHADVDHHARRPEQLGVEHARADRRRRRGSRARGPAVRRTAPSPRRGRWCRRAGAGSR